MLTLFHWRFPDGSFWIFGVRKGLTDPAWQVKFIIIIFRFDLINVSWRWESFCCCCIRAFHTKNKNLLLNEFVMSCRKKLAEMQWVAAYFLWSFYVSNKRSTWDFQWSWGEWSANKIFWKSFSYSVYCVLWILPEVKWRISWEGFCLIVRKEALNSTTEFFSSSQS